MKFFHNSIKSRRRRNKIEKLTCADGSITTNEEVMFSLIHDYFEVLF